jgi:PelA/Pel-15E family pectate lyase
MVGVLKLLRDIAQGKAVYSFVDEDRRSQARDAVQKGIDCILKTQVVVKGERTVWGAQHDEVTLAPAPARAFEPASLASAESVGVVRFLMSLSKPNQQIIDAVESAIKWFEASKIAGIKWIEKVDSAKRGNAQWVVVHDKTAEPIWARFYEIGTNRGIFIGRDGIVKYNIDEIEEERRNGYRWYVDEPNQLLNKDYPSWLKKWPH